MDSIDVKIDSHPCVLNTFPLPFSAVGWILIASRIIQIRSEYKWEDERKVNKLNHYPGSSETQEVQRGDAAECHRARGGGPWKQEYLTK